MNCVMYKVAISFFNTFQIKSSVNLGVHKEEQCLAVHPSYFEGKAVNQQHILSHLTKAGLGKSHQPGRFPGKGKSERCLLIYLKAFNAETHKIIKGT